MSATKSYPSFLLAFAILSALAVPVNAQFVRDPEAVQALEAGNELLQQEEWDSAIAAFSAAIEKDNTFSEAYVGLGDAFRNIEDYESAIDNYVKALDIPNSPVRAGALFGRGMCLKELGQYNAAATDISEAIKLDRNNPEINAEWGDLLVNNIRDANRAMRFLDLAIELDPENARAYRNRGLAHMALREEEESVADVKKSIELDPEDYESYTALASAYLFQDDLELAIEALSGAIDKYKPEESTDPDSFLSGYLQRSDSQIQLALKKSTPEAQKEALYAGAIADSDAVLEELPDSYPASGNAFFRKGLALRLQGKIGESIKALTDAIQLAPPGETSGYIAEAYLKRGICWHYQEQGSLARGDLEQAASINYEDPLPHLWIGYSYAQEGDYRKAIDSYGEAIAKNGSFPLIYVNRGLAYMQMGEFKKGVENFNEAIRNEPDDKIKARHFFKRGVAYLWMEDYQKAFDSFHHATLNDDTYGAAFRRAADALRKLGRVGIADEYQRRADELEAVAS